MANGFGDNHAARAPPEIGCQDNQACIAKILNRTRRYQDDSRRNGFYVRCMLGRRGDSVEKLETSHRPGHSKTSIKVKNPNAGNARPERFDKVAQVLLFTFRIFGAPRIRIVGHRVGACLSPFPGAFGRPLRIVKLIGPASDTENEEQPCWLNLSQPRQSSQPVYSRPVRKRPFHLGRPPARRLRQPFPTRLTVATRMEWYD